MAQRVSDAGTSGALAVPDILTAQESVRKHRWSQSVLAPLDSLLSNSRKIMNSAKVWNESLSIQ